MIEFTKVKPSEIEAESFRIIENEFEIQTGREISDFDRAEFEIIRRAIHTTGDFSFAAKMYFSKDGIAKAVEALKEGRAIYGDVSMVTSGISRPFAKKFGNEVFSLVHDEETALTAREKGITRAEAAMFSLQHRDIGLVVIGNAPTALIRCVKLVQEKIIKPAAVIGVPVGFVNAVESKQYLMESGLDCISCKGRSGGSTVAASIVNALYRLI